MQKDIKDLFEDYKGGKVNLTSNHVNKFETKLMKELHEEKPKKTHFKWLSIFASITLLITLLIGFFNKETEPINPKENKITLGAISPELNTIETYYVNSINSELSEIELTDDNKELLDGYLLKIKELSKEYALLTEELSTKGVNDETINALISNLQLRL